MAEVLFQGTKTFWKTKNSVNLTILEHHGHDVIEVVTYEPTLQVEAPRLYLDIERIIPFLENESGLLNESDATLASELSKFVFNRLRVSLYLPTSKALEVEVQRGFGAKEQGVDFQITVERPVDLVPYSRSSRCSQSTERTASINERWRLPLILVRLQRGLTLRGEDKAIYSRFCAGKSQSEMVAAFARVLGTVVRAHEADDLQRVAHSIVLEPQMPFPAPTFRAPSPQTLPQGFVQSVLQAEAARRPSRPASPASSPTTPPATLPPLQTASPGSSGKRGLRNILNLAGARNGISSAPTSNPSSAASSVNSSPAGSRASSPSRGSRDSPPHSFLLPPLSPGVGFGDKTRTAPQWDPFDEHFSALLSGHCSPVPQCSEKANEMSVKPPLGLMHTPRSPSEHDDDDEGLLGLGVSSEEGSVDVYPSAQVKPKGGKNRLAALRGRRSTFDVPTGQLSSTASDITARTCSVQHMRGGSGGTLSGILGLSAVCNRISPDTWTEDGSN
jgi:hypothetical protein